MARKDEMHRSMPERLKILHIIPDLSVAGAESKLYRLLMATDRRRFTPAVLSLRDRGELKAGIEKLGIDVYTLGMRRSLAGPRSIYRLARIVRQLDPDLIHGWMYHGNIAAQAAAKFARRRVTVIWSIHQSLYSFALEKPLTAMIIKLGALCSRLPSRIIYISNTSAGQHKAAGYSKDNALVFYYGFDPETFAPSAHARLSLRSELNLTPDAFLVGLIGRYHPVKDHATFLKAGALLVKSYPNLRLVLCGKHVDFENRALRDLIEELQLSRYVYLLGERRDIPRITAALDIAASSSCTEGFPNVVGEAMASGVPCVVTDVSDLAVIVGETGKVVPPGNPAAMAAALTELVVMGPAGRAKLGAQARGRIIEHYSLEASIAQYQEIYERTFKETKLKLCAPLSRQTAALSGPQP